MQWNKTTATISNKFRVGETTTRTLTGRRTLGKTTVGDQVCHYGHSTGYSCGVVEKVGVSIGALDSENADKYPGNFWVQVKTPTCAEGDSGGPAFTARTIASGIVSLQPNDNETKNVLGTYIYQQIKFMKMAFHSFNDVLV